MILMSGSVPKKIAARNAAEQGLSPIRPYAGERYWMYRTDNLLSFISYADLTAEKRLALPRLPSVDRGQPHGDGPQVVPVCREKVEIHPQTKKKAED